ncbi:hypothetical protein EJ06DRAFT_558593 [Trichodelitschia bisporula]|uniref:DUF788-domain-containing protein n=1 Tax=Trichodelitschia bisporula TaxID=703511 RepID=A0A6G1HR45_9PEZI|nr:hypothetical protein EJ06DRAFT_558593 [Trichodelitschia bisporula]
MANKATKALAARNTVVLDRTRLITLAVHAVFIILRCFIFRSSLTKRTLVLYALLSTPSLVIQFWFEKVGRPQYGLEPGELRKGGEDLEAKGLTEWMWDVLYWTYGCLVLVAVLGDWAWWAWIVVPFYSAYLAYTAFAGVKQSMAGLAGPAAEGDPASSKRQQKLQKKAQKSGGVQYR